MFSPSPFTASTPCETAVCACSTTPVATRFTRSSGEFFRPPPERLADERFAVERLAEDFLTALFFAPPRFAAPRADDFLAALFRADPFFAAPFFAAPLRAPPLFAPPFFADERLAPRLAPPRRAEPLPALRLLPPFFFVAIAALLAGWWLSVLREIVAVCARFGRMVASGDPAATSEATEFVVRPCDVRVRDACTDPRR